MRRLICRYRPVIGMFFCISLFMQSSLADEDIRISNAWINEAPPGMKMMGGYLTISNKTTHPLVLTGASSPCFERIEFHVTEMKDGLSTMHRQDSIPIPAGSEFNFAPGHDHLMLINNTRTLATGDKVPLTLNFAQGESLQIEAEVRRGDPSAHQHH